MTKTKSTNFEIIKNTIFKLTPAHLLDNFMMLFVFLCAISATIIFLNELYILIDINFINIPKLSDENIPTNKTLLYGQMTLWIWLTIFFSKYAEELAKSKLPYTLHNIKTKDIEKNSHDILVKKIFDKENQNYYEFTPLSLIKDNDIILLRKGDISPFDGKIVKGSCFVRETTITGQLDLNLKTDTQHDIITKNSIIESMDNILLSKSPSTHKSLSNRANKLISKIYRQQIPSEIALQKIILGLSILFITVIFTIGVIANYSGQKIPMIYLIDLVVILLPTTISGLQYAVILFAKSKLHLENIHLIDNSALDSALDINALLIDKTGTITEGKRKMLEFHPLIDMDEEEFWKYLYLSSKEDNSPEGKSILNFLREKADFIIPQIKSENYRFTEFSSDRPISGCDYGKLQIRKGSFKAIQEYLGLEKHNLPDNLFSLKEKIAESYGTPLLLTVHKKIIAVIELQDKILPDIKNQIDKLKNEKMKIIMVTGDNELSAKFICNKVGIDEFKANYTTEDKLKFVHELQKKGYYLAMYGDDTHDSLALAKADIGIVFDDNVSDLNENHLHPKPYKHIHSLHSNIIASRGNLLSIIELKNICKKMTIKRGALTIFSLLSDISKYFVIVPALFVTSFPALEQLNFMEFKSIESVVLASITFNALVILAFIPIINNKNNWGKTNKSLWRYSIIFAISGLISPFIFIKLFEEIILFFGLISI